MQKVMTILYDSREQDPWKFTGRRCRTRRVGLRTGDYSVQGFSTQGIVIERKSMQDLYGTMASGRERFRRELSRLAKFDMAFLVIEASLESVLRGVHWSSINPGRMVDSLHRECLGAGVVPLFAHGKLMAEEVAFKLLKGFWEAKADEFKRQAHF